ncbi:MAG: glycoside hydrolase family 130 protein [Planctomycetes bacterium]|nr:glycoside hydrolase family 130 protein [Planctomycetota bacterium]
MTVHVTRLPIQLLPDSSRVITRFFGPGDENRIRDIIKRMLAIPETKVEPLLASLESNFRLTHPNIDDVFLQHFELVKNHVSGADELSDNLRLLIGACFTMEYAIESAALFNPSMVPALDQAGLPPGSVRFLMSLRATGEGHISSIVFRRGVVDANGGVSVDPPGQRSRTMAAVAWDSFEKAFFVRELQALGAWTNQAQATLTLLGDRFTRAQLSDAIDAVRARASVSGKSEEANDAMFALTRANYHLHLPEDGDISELVIFPHSDNERHGIEDMRLVQFTDDDGLCRYYGTYTAYDGSRIFPQLLEYRKDENIEIHMLSGGCAKNKGMALFPRKIDGKYAMVARLDNENLYYMESDDVYTWDRARLLQTPRFPWEVIQIGNCGSPLETEAGWLLLTHGVGPMRQYCIGATLLDHDDPCRVIGQTSQPLLVPTGKERIGYVPNVVYSCGGMIHMGFLILPYAMSDSASSIAVINVDELISSLEQ